MKPMSTGGQILLVTGLYLLASVGLLASVLRTDMVIGVLAGGPLPDDWVDLRYAEHPWLSLAHVVPGALYLFLGPLQVLPGLRRRWPGMHRWLGRVALVGGLISALSILWVVVAFPAMGGWLTIVASWVFGLYMAAALVLALRAIRARRVMDHRAWMIRAYSIGIAISTIRIIGILADAVLGIDFAQNFGLTVTLGFAIHAIAAEVILRRRISPAGSTARQAP